MNRPNIVFILADDLGWMDLSCQGSNFYETPNIDRISREGMRFTDAYASCPVCSPTRASLMTGKYPARLGLTHYIWDSPDHYSGKNEKGKLLGVPYIPYLSTGEKSLASALKQHGYRTWHIGKWHLGRKEYWPERHGFDINIGGCDKGHPDGAGHYFAPWDIPTIAPKEGDCFLTDRLGDEAVDLIMSNDGTPFFLNMWFYAVHTPVQAKPAKIRKYRQKAAALGLDSVEPFVKGDFFPSENKKNKRIERRIIQSSPEYAGLIEHLDENVGKIMDALDRKGIAENTIVIFTSDNGGLSTAESSPTCNSPLLEGKGWMYEGGIREPLLVSWPGKIRPGSVSDTVVTSCDFYPTILEACGLPPEKQQHVDGKSFLHLFEGRNFERSPVFWHFPHYANQGGTPACAIRKGDWKLIEFFEHGIELYNLRNDIGEKNNLAAVYPETACSILAELHAWRKEMNAIIPIQNPDWKPWRDADLNPMD